MSWTITVPVRPLSAGGHLLGVDEAIEGACLNYHDQQRAAGHKVPAETRDQIDAAAQVARALVDSGAVGDGITFAITLSGHANPEHMPRGGWADDFVSVSVAQVNNAISPQPVA